MKYYIAVYQKLRDIYVSRGMMENDHPMLCPSLRMYQIDDLELLKPTPLIKDKEKKIEAIIRKQSVSYELNSVPISPYFWDSNLNTSLFDIYREILNFSNIKDFEINLEKITEDSSTILNDARNNDTKEYKNYKKYRLNYENILQKLSDHLMLFNDISKDDTEGLSNWKEQLMNLHNQKELAMSEWKVRGFKNLIEKEIQRINKLSDADYYVNLSQYAKNTFDAAEETDITSYTSIHDINFVPFDFMENESGWNKLKLNKAELEALYENAKNNNTDLPTEILSIDYNEKTVVGIELDFTFVHLQRSWFNKSIMFSNFFEWKQKKPISDGQTISDAFRLPAFPKTMMLIKNLKIILDQSVTSNDVNDPNQLIFFGPLVMKQQLFINQNNNDKFLKAVTDKEILRSDQMTYLAKKTSPPVLEIKTTETIKPTINENLVTPVKPSVLEIHEAQTSTVIMDRMKMGSVLTSRPILTAIQPTFMNYSTVLNTKSNLATDSKPFRKPMKPHQAPKPMETPKPYISPVLISDSKLTSAVFVPINLPPAPPSANVTFKVYDKSNREPVYKCEISIIGTNSNNETNRIFNIETDNNGVISQNLPVGNYKISMKINEFAPLEANINIQNTNPQTFEYLLQRMEIKFKSVFLIGMICEKLPKIPFE